MITTVPPSVLHVLAVQGGDRGGQVPRAAEATGLIQQPRSCGHSPGGNARRGVDPNPRP